MKRFVRLFHLELQHQAQGVCQAFPVPAGGAAHGSREGRANSSSTAPGRVGKASHASPANQG